MSRDFRNLLWVLVGVVLGGLSSYASATTTYKAAFYSSSFSGTYINPLAAATGRCTYYGKSYVSHSYQESNINPVCNPVGGGSVGFSVSCPNGGTLEYPYHDNTQCLNAPDCPGGQFRDWAGVCQPNCVAPQVFDSVNRVCTAPPNPCVAGVATTVSTWTGAFVGPKPGVYVGNWGTKPAVGSSGCDGMCISTITTGSSSCSSALTNGASVPGTPVSCVDPAVRTDVPCSTAVNGNPGTYDPCFAQGQVAGTVNGVAVCTGSAPTTSSTTKTSTTNNSTTVTTTTTSCSGDGACSSSVSSSVTSGGSGPNGTGPGSTTGPGADDGKGDVQDKPGFCEENPDSAICKTAEDECIENPTRIGCSTLGDVADSDLLVPVDSGLAALTPFALATNESCPANINLPKGAVISWAPICDVAGWLKPLVLAFAWLSAGLIVVGGVRS